VQYNEKLGSTYPVTQDHVPKEWNPQAMRHYLEGGKDT